ncbi:Protein ORANGE-GREEN [Chlorella vulgaris]
MHLPCCACVSKPLQCTAAYTPGPQPRRLFDPLHRTKLLIRPSAASSDPGPVPQPQPSPTSSYPDAVLDSAALPENFCIIESPESDFAALQLEEIEKNIASRRNKIFLLMEEVRRLRIQLRLRGVAEEQIGALDEDFPSSIPFFPPITEKTINLYQRFYAITVAAIIAFGGIIAPVLEVHLGIGGASYNDFIRGMHLPTQLAQVDPIVASFCGGGVGVLTALLIVEINNAKMQEKRRCIYCEGSGYLTCGTCVGCGTLESGSCANCAGTGKVMCTSCLCTGKKLATEHDPRVDPFTLNV